MNKTIYPHTWRYRRFIKDCTTVREDMVNRVTPLIDSKKIKDEIRAYIIFYGAMIGIIVCGFKLWFGIGK